MKFTNGYWLTRTGIDALFAVEIDDIRIDPNRSMMTVYVPTGVIRGRGDTLNRPMLTIEYSSPAEGIIKTRIVHHAGGIHKGPSFEVSTQGDYLAAVALDDDAGTLTAGDLTVRVPRSGRWRADFYDGRKRVTSSLPKSVGYLRANGSDPTLTGTWVHEQLSLEPGERVYGLGERFGALAKNGQVVDIWNEDGGTSSEQAYKNVPFYWTTKGYGVFVNHPELVSFEVGSEVNTRVQFSVSGEVLEYFVIAGPTPKDVIRRYTGLTGRPAPIPAWSYGLWLTTSFTTDYNEATVTSFIDGMLECELPLSVFHFDCFWMREYEWCGFQWDPRAFPDPTGQIARLHERGLRVCLWINPYIAQRTDMFAEGLAKGYFLKTVTGEVWQWDNWQAGMALVDFTNPEATAWYLGELEALLDQGVDCFKTDFGERIPVDGVIWHDGSDPGKMHNYYSQMYNKAVFELLERKRGRGEAVLFARSATAGGQQFPVHWGGDSDSTYASMAESLRGGLSLGMSGFGYWASDIGGFEGTPDSGVFKRWVAFGLLSSHSRLHGSGSYRVPWAFDDEAVNVTRIFTQLKMSLMPYLARIGLEAHTDGLAMMRSMALEFPDDRTGYDADMQYMLGDSLLVAPIFTPEGTAEVYIPEGTWTSFFDGSTVNGPRWVTETHGFGSLPLYVRPGTVLPIGNVVDRPEYDWASGVTLRCFELPDGYDGLTVIPHFDGSGAEPSQATAFRVQRVGSIVTVSTADAHGDWAVQVGSEIARATGPGTITVPVPILY